MNNKALIAIAIIVVLIAGGLGVYYFLTNNSNNKNNNNNLNPTPTATLTETPTVTTTSSAETNEVSIVSSSFSPATITVKKGTTVIWTNNDSTIHTVTSLTSAFDSGNLSPDAKFSFTFETTGEFDYRCTIHSMVGKIIVTD